ncbi:MAG: alpha-L-fucosidase [Bryobacteraceae bacterium]
MRALGSVVLALVISAAGYGQTYQQRVAKQVQTVDKVAGAGPFHPAWDSLETHATPDWYKDAKFGIFIHWGLYSVPAFGSEWYPREMYMQGSKEFKHHVATFGPQMKFGYKDFIPMFKAEKFDPKAWADLFRNAGAKYVVPVAEHHDGFPMYDCSFTDWSAAKMGPKRDIVGQLAAAVRADGMHLGASSHRIEHWFFMEGGRKFDSDVRDPRYESFYGPAQPEKTADGKENQPNETHMRDWLARTSELIDKYKPEVLWFDWWIEQPVMKPYLQKLAAFYYNRGAEWKGPGVAINYKKEAFPEKAAVLDIERGKLDKPRDLFWQTDTSVSVKSWGYIENDQFRTPASLIDDLIDIVSKNGCLLLNIGPRSDGTIPDQVQHVLLEMGRWLSVNGEAIYGTRPWTTFGEGPTKVVGGSFKDTASKPFTGEDIRFTAKGNTIYAIALAWPQSGKLVVKSLANYPAKSVELLGSQAKLQWSKDTAGLHVQLPADKRTEYAVALRVR